MMWNSKPNKSSGTFPRNPKNDMSEYYKAKRTKNIFDPLKHGSVAGHVAGTEPFKISRSKIDLFLNCPRCFYLDRRLGVARPPGYPFNLNSAVDALLKKEFDIHRAAKTAHQLMEQYGIDAVPFEDERMDEWRDSLRRGIQFLHEKTNLLITGGVDDVWVNPMGELIIVDYKATSKNGEVSLDAEWQIGYKRQMEVYQWLFRKNGFPVSKVGYFVYCNGDTDKEAFDAKLEFDITVIPYTGDDSWVEGTILDIRNCLDGDLPESGPDCDYCAYRDAVREVEK